MHGKLLRNAGHLAWIALFGCLLVPAVGADGEGTATISPSGIVLAGTTGTWTITYTAGPPGIAPGGGLRLALSGFPIRLFATPQCDDPTKPNYTTARCSNPAVPVKVQMSRALRGGWQDVQTLQVTVGKPGLRQGDRLIIIYGDTSGGGPGGRIRWAEGDDLPLRIYSDTDGDGTYQPLSAFPRITIAGGMAARLVLYGPSQAVVRAPVRLAVSGRDGRGFLATKAPERIVIDGEGLAHPVEVKFPRGRRAIGGATVTFVKPGIYRLSARVPAAPRRAVTIGASAFVSARRPAPDAEPAFRPELRKVIVSATRVRPGSVLQLRTYWTNAGPKPASRPYRIFCHLERRPAKGKALANWDHWPAVETTEWQPGHEIVDEHSCPISDQTPAGEHMLTIGLYRLGGPGKFINLVAYEICRIELSPNLPLVVDIPPALSNPIQVLPKPPRWKLLWGDIHCHSEMSGDGSASIRGLYTYARDVSRLDFCACTDHISPSFPIQKWRKIQAAARTFNAPGRFVAILAYEWSNMYHGDKNVYFLRDDEAIRVPRSGQAEDLWPMLAGVDCVVIPHHPAYPVGLRGTDWTRIDPSFVPVVEMCSAHGIGEYFGNPRPYGRNKPMGPSLPGGFAQDALARGLELGFICSSDDHSGHPGKLGPIVAVYADSLTRRGILDALRARRCYGTTGSRMILTFTADGKPMGSELQCSRPPLLRVEVHAPAAIDRVEIVRNGKVCHTERPSGTTGRFTYRDRDMSEENVYYYVRITQVDGHMGWSSPVFVQNVGPLPRLTVTNVTVTPAPPRPGRPAMLEAVVRNAGRRTAQPAVVWFTIDGPPSIPARREYPPARSGIGGLMMRPGLQVWRWPVGDEAVNVFIRWGGDDSARDCSGSVRVLDAMDYVWTPFHPEHNDKYEEPTRGLIQWSTTAEPGTGDGLNLWVLIDPCKRTHLQLDFKRGGKRRPEEIFTRAGPVKQLPFELDLVRYHAGRWIGEASIPALEPGQARRIRLSWTPLVPARGTIVWQLRDPSRRHLLASGSAGEISQAR